MFKVYWKDGSSDGKVYESSDTFKTKKEARAVEARVQSRLGFAPGAGAWIEKVKR